MAHTRPCDGFKCTYIFSTNDINLDRLGDEILSYEFKLSSNEVEMGADAGYGTVKEIVTTQDIDCPICGTTNTLKVAAFNVKFLTNANYSIQELEEEIEQYTLVDDTTDEGIEFRQCKHEVELFPNSQENSEDELPY